MTKYSKTDIGNRTDKPSGEKHLGKIVFHPHLFSLHLLHKRQKCQPCLIMKVFHNIHYLYTLYILKLAYPPVCWTVWYQGTGKPRCMTLEVSHCLQNWSTAEHMWHLHLSSLLAAHCPLEREEFKMAWTYILRTR